MLDVEQYISRVLEVADLTRKDERRVYDELQLHMEKLLHAGAKSGLTESEVMSMVEKEFGDPKELGEMIAKARGKFRTYLKKKARKTTICLAVAIIVAFSVRAVAFEAYHVTSDAASPRVPESSRVLVNKLANNFKMNDIVVFRTQKQAMIGTIKEIDKDGVIVSRKNREDIFVSKNEIVGKAFLLYFLSL